MTTSLSINDASNCAADGRQLRVLLADDSDTARELAKLVLRRMGHNVDVAGHGEEALRAAQAFRYDLIVLDLEMPRMDGVSAAREIRALSGPAGRVPILAVSGFLLSNGHGIDELFDGAMAKPVSRQRLGEAIERAVARRRSQIDAAEQGHTLPIVDPAVLDGIRDQVLSEDWIDLVRTVASDLTRFSDTLCQMQINGNRASLHFAAHSLRDLAVSFGAPQLAWQAGKLEKAARQQSLDRLEGMASEVRDCARSTAVTLTRIYQAASAGRCV